VSRVGIEPHESRTRVFPGSTRGRRSLEASTVLAVTERRDIRANQSEVATTSRSAKPVLLIGRVRPSWSLISGYFGPIGSRQLGDLDCVIKYCGAQEE